MTDDSSVCDFNAKDYDVGDDEDSRDSLDSRCKVPGNSDKSSLEEMNEHVSIAYCSVL